MEIIKGKCEIDNGKDIAAMKFGLNGEVHIDEEKVELEITYGKADIINDGVVYFTNDDICMKLYLRTNFYNNRAEIAYIIRFNYNHFKWIKNRVVEEITEFSFEISNLQDWLKIKPIEDHPMCAGYIDIEDIIIKKSNPKILIRYDKELFDHGYDNTKVVLQSKPYIVVQYDNPTTILGIENDIAKIVNFFGIMIGRIERVNDINFIISECGGRFEFITCKDYSHNALLNMEYIYDHRTSFSSIKYDLDEHFKKWEKLNYNYEDIVIYFFMMHDKRKKYLEDTFITWCKMIDGYYCIKNNLNARAKRLKDIVKESLELTEMDKKIKELLNNSDFEQQIIEKYKLENVKRDYKTNDFCDAIEGKFLSKFAFKDKIAKVCKENFDFFYENIESLNVNENINAFYEKCNKTRNYYSHLGDNENCLSYKQMRQCEGLFYSTFISIFMKEIGFSEEEIENILHQDDVVKFNRIKKIKL